MFSNEYCGTEILKFCTQTGSVRNSETFRLQNGQNLLCRVCPGDQHPKRRMLWSQLSALRDFQNL